MLEGHIQQFSGSGLTHVVRIAVIVLAAPEIPSIDVMLMEQILDELDVAAGNLSAQFLVSRDGVLIRHIVRDQ